jgi:hypothetical protein
VNGYNIIKLEIDGELKGKGFVEGIGCRRIRYKSK